MSNENLKKLDYAYNNYREVFNRHFKSLDEAKEIEARALAGDDKAMVKLWMLYQDGEFRPMKTRGSAAAGMFPRELTLDCSRFNKIDFAIANNFKEMARAKFNPDGMDFINSVKYGNRNAIAEYVLYRDLGLGAVTQESIRTLFTSDETSRTANHWENPIILGNLHLRYQEDAWRPALSEYENASIDER